MKLNPRNPHTWEPAIAERLGRLPLWAQRVLLYASIAVAVAGGELLLPDRFQW